MKQYKLLEYIEDGKSFYAEWFNRLDAVAAARVDKYVSGRIIILLGGGSKRHQSKDIAEAICR